MNARELHHLIHRLWTRAVGTPNYNKKDWLLLEAELTTLCRTNGQNISLMVPSDDRGSVVAPSVWERIKNPAL